jgi:hypothetical protein
MSRDPLKAALESKLASYESAGMTELADRQRAALSKLAKTVKDDAKATEDAKASTPKAKKAAPATKSVLKKK